MTSWIAQKGHTFSSTNLWEGQGLPEIESFDSLIVMGGPMNIYEEKKYPWLKGIPLWKWIAEDSFGHEAEHIPHLREWRDARAA